VAGCSHSVHVDRDSCVRVRLGNCEPLDVKFLTLGKIYMIQWEAKTRMK
jgi:hypothetical protein